MATVSRVQMYCESRSSPSDAVSRSMRTMLGGIDSLRHKRISIDKLRIDSDGSGRYCVSMRISIEATA